MGNDFGDMLSTDVDYNASVLSLQTKKVEFVVEAHLFTCSSREGNSRVTDARLVTNLNGLRRVMYDFVLR